MGEGLYRHPDGRTVQCEPFADLDPADALAWRDASADLDAIIASCLSDAWDRVPRTWRRGGERILLRNGLHEVWLYEDGYARVHVTFGLRGDLDGTEALASALLTDRAEAFFDRLSLHYELRVRASAWTSAARVHRRAVA